jgi:hypothetical protein
MQLPCVDGHVHLAYAPLRRPDEQACAEAGRLYECPLAPVTASLPSEPHAPR